MASLASGAIQNFTFTFFANGTPSLAFSGYATGVDAVSLKGVTATPAISNAVSVFAQGNLKVANISFTPVLAALSVGQLFTVAVTVQDNGQGDSLTITGEALQPFGAGGAASLSWTTAANMVSLTAGNSTVFTYVYTASNPGTLGFSAKADGLNTSLGPISSQLVPSTSFGSLLTIQAPASLVASWSLPAQASIGQIATAVLSVTNTGTAQANNVTTIAMPFVNGSGALSLLTQPNLAPNLASGASQFYTYTFSPTAVGSVALTAQADGLDVNTGLNVTSTVATSSSMNIQLATSLTASITVQPTSMKVGDFMTVVMTVANEAGAATAANVVPQGIAANVSYAVAVLTGPVPALVPALPGGASVSFTWTYSAADLAATLNFTASAGAADGNSAFAVSAVAATSNNSQIVSNQPTLTALWAAPSPLTATVGQLVTAVLQVTDTNLLVNAANVLPSSVLPSNALQSSGPVPPTVASLLGGASAFFTYTYSFTAAGSYSFSGNASSNAGSVLANVTQSPAVLVQSPAILTVSSVVLTPTGGVSLGQAFTLYVTVSNTGGGGRLRRR